MANEMPTGFPSTSATSRQRAQRRLEVVELERRAAELEAEPIHKKALVEAAKANAKDNALVEAAKANALANALVEAAKAIERGQMEENHNKAQKSFQAASLWIDLAKTISEHKP